ncbi:MAG TPA: hypothetical protein PLG56_07795 [Lacunisphaera sp.]|jgi:hypothetical protein|nr:hypothetical protein [Lacunisphaera sp.]
MAWVPTSTSGKAPSKPTWEELAKLEETSPGLTRLPPGRLVASPGMRSVRKPLAKGTLMQVLAEAGIGRKKRSIVLRKIEHSQGYVIVNTMDALRIEAAQVTGQSKPAKKKERAFVGDVD